MSIPYNTAAHRLDVLDQIEADCGRIVTGDNTYAEIDLTAVDVNHIEAQVTV